MKKRQNGNRGMAILRVAVIVSAACILVALLWFTLLSSKNRERRELEQSISESQAKLASKGHLREPDILRHDLNKEISHNKELIEEWSNTVSRLNGFQGLPLVSSTRIGKIDYKVALFDVKQRLLKKARALDINLPSDIGMDAVVKSNEDARRLMYQLKAVETLLDTALNINIKTVKFVEPISPTGYHPENATETFVEEYPVRIRLYGNVESLYDLLSAACSSDHFFILRHLKVRSVSEDKPDLLDISAVMSALLFIKSPDEMVSIRNTAAPVAITPRGH